MILAGDISGTKTVLAIYAGRTQVPLNPVHEIRFKSGNYQSFETIVKKFLDQTGAKPQAACFGVAGPVKDRHSPITNLPWKINSDEIEPTCGIPPRILKRLARSGFSGSIADKGRSFLLLFLSLSTQNQVG